MSDERSNLRGEISVYNWQLYITSLVMLVLMIYTSFKAREQGFTDVILFVPLLGIGWAFAMGRYDYLIHRVGAFLRPDSEWEKSEIRNRKKGLLVGLDLGSMVPFLALISNAEYVAWGMGYSIFVIVTSIVIVLGVASIAISASAFSSDE